MTHTPSTHKVYLSLGSNLGNRSEILRAAVQRLELLPGTSLLAASAISETPPWGHIAQPAFLNMAVALATTLEPESLLAALQVIEHEFGRVRAERWGARTLDIDILVYEGEERDTSQLHLPHPWLTRRRFVLAPLADIAPDLYVQGKTVREWLDGLE